MSTPRLCSWKRRKRGSPSSGGLEAALPELAKEAPLPGQDGRTGTRGRGGASASLFVRGLSSSAEAQECLLPLCNATRPITGLCKYIFSDIIRRCFFLKNGVVLSIFRWSPSDAPAGCVISETRKSSGQACRALADGADPGEGSLRDAVAGPVRDGVKPTGAAWVCHARAAFGEGAGSGPEGRPGPMVRKSLTRQL